MANEVAKGVLIGLVMFGALCWAIRLWTYAPPLPPEEFNDERWRNRLKTIPLWFAFSTGVIYLFEIT